MGKMLSDTVLHHLIEDFQGQVQAPRLHEAIDHRGIEHRVDGALGVEDPGDNIRGTLGVIEASAGVKEDSEGDLCRPD